MITSVHLVSCVGQKLDHSAPAKELYVSDWFKKARAYVEGQGGPRWILSAKHGLLAPDAEIEPYDVSLTDMCKSDRWAWGERVLLDLDRHLRARGRVTLLAGKTYREPLLAGLALRGYVVHEPLAHLRFGKQKHWLAAHTR